MILITGASRGIGYFLFNKFLEKGIDVIGTYNSSNVNSDTELLYKVDVANYESVKNWILMIKNRCRNIVVLNCAGVSYNSIAHKADIQKWTNVIDVNLKGTFNVIHQVLPLMREQGYGRIINFSSVVTSLPTPGTSAYCASKAGLLGLTKTLALENASKGITVNSIILGYVNIGMGVNDVPDDYKKIIINQIPAGKFCDPDDIYKTVNYMIETSYLNGAAIELNGALI